MKKQENKILSYTARDPIGDPLSDSIRSGVIEALLPDGLIRVKDTLHPQHIIGCHHLRTTAGAPPAYAVGDEVLYTQPVGATTGCVLGVVALYRRAQDELTRQLTQTGRNPSTTTLHDEVVHIKAEHGLVIECGKGTIIITQDGKIQIKGTELLSRARGMNKIKGAGVDIN